MTYDPKIIGQRVRQARTDEGLTQAELAERADLAFVTISRIENGREPPSLRTLVAIADAFGTGVYALLGHGGTPVRARERVSPEARRLATAIAKLDPKLAKHLAAVVAALALPAKRGGKYR